jgi:TonB family protein
VAVAPAAAPPPRIYGPDDAIAVPPASINQVLPPFRGPSPIPRMGLLEVVIDETGAVQSAVMTMSLTPAYDKMAVSAAKSWRYRPATVNGVPVKYRKVVQITVKAML